MTLLLAIDGGGTRTRCIAVDRHGVVRGAGAAGPSNHMQAPAAEAMASLRAATEAALLEAGASASDVAMVSAGLAGIDVDGTGREEGLRIVEAAGFARAVVWGDMVIAHRGALAGSPGVVALAGTGSSVLGVAADGTAVKAGGWGPLYGDHGSAWQIAQLGLAAAAEAFDGSGPPTALVEQLSDALGVLDFRATAPRLYSARASQREIAALAPVVSAAAEAGDAVADAICRRAGVDLARIVRTAAARTAGAAGCRVSYQGAVLERSVIVRRAFCEALADGVPSLRVSAPLLPAVAGAILLGAGAAGWELHAETLEALRGV